MSVVRHGHVEQVRRVVVDGNLPKRCPFRSSFRCRRSEIKCRVVPRTQKVSVISQDDDYPAFICVASRSAFLPHRTGPPLCYPVFVSMMVSRHQGKVCPLLTLFTKFALCLHKTDQQESTSKMWLTLLASVTQPVWPSAESSIPHADQNKQSGFSRSEAFSVAAEQAPSLVLRRLLQYRLYITSPSVFDAPDPEQLKVAEKGQGDSRFELLWPWRVSGLFVWQSLLMGGSSF